MAIAKTIKVPIDISSASYSSGVVSPSFTVIEMPEVIFDQLAAAQDRIESLEREVARMKDLITEMYASEKGDRMLRLMEEVRR
jgi:hypothetical protein